MASTWPFVLTVALALFQVAVSYGIPSYNQQQAQTSTYEARPSQYGQQQPLYFNPGYQNQEYYTLNTNDYDFYQINPGQTFHFIQQPGWDTIIIEQQPEEIIINYTDPEPPTVVEVVPLVEDCQENDYAETQLFIKKAQSDLEAIFKSANDEVTRNERQAAEQAQAARDAIQTLAQKGMTLMAGAERSSNQCVRTVHKEVQDTVRANTQAGLQCIDKAQKTGQTKRSVPRDAIKNGRGLARQQNEMDIEDLSMCVASQFKLCEEEREQMRKSVLGAELAAHTDVAQAIDAITTEIGMLAECLNEAVEDFEDMQFDTTNAVEICQTRQ